MVVPQHMVVLGFSPCNQRKDFSSASPRVVRWWSLDRGGGFLPLLGIEWIFTPHRREDFLQHHSGWSAGVCWTMQRWNFAIAWYSMDFHPSPKGGFHQMSSGWSARCIWTARRRNLTITWYRMDFHLSPKEGFAVGVVPAGLSLGAFSNLPWWFYQRVEHLASPRKQWDDHDCLSLFSVCPSSVLIPRSLNNLTH